MRPSPPRRSTRALLIALLVAGPVGLGVAIRAADHADSPDTSEGNLDINDIYAFNQGDDVVLIMTVAPLLTPGEATDNAALNPRGLYSFNLDVERDGVAEAVVQVATAGLGASQTVIVRGPTAPETSGTTTRVIPGPRLSGRFGEIIEGSGITAWVGPSDDPFFIDLFGDESLTSVLNAVYGAALGQTIGDPGEQTLAFAEPGMDDLAGLNTLSIVVQLPKARVAEALGIPADGTFWLWGTTSVR
jgi:hypothetical protein